MLSPRMTVVCPTWTPATSVIASSGPVGKMPTFSPMSEARGRALGGVFWAAANAAVNKTVATAKSLLAMGIAYDQIPVLLASPKSEVYYVRVAHHPLRNHIFRQADFNGVSRRRLH